MIYSPAVTVVAILIDLRRALAVRRVGHHVITVTYRLLLRHWRLNHNVVLGCGLILVIRPRREEHQGAADPQFLRIVRQVPYAYPVRRLHHDVTWPLRAIPVAP